MGTSRTASLEQANRIDVATEPDWPALLQTGEPEGFDAFVRAYQDRVARLAARLLGHDADAADVVQETFLSVLLHIKRFRRDSRFATWVTAITINKCRSFVVKRERRARLLRWMSWAMPRPTETSPDSPNDESDLVRLAIDALPMSLREPIVLRYFEEMPIDEIAETLRISTTAVEIRLTRARKKLKETLSAPLAP